MKYSYMSFSTPRGTLAEMLELARKLGYDGIEPRVEVKHAHGVELSADPAARRGIRKKIEDSGMALACIATSCRFADPALAGEQVKSALQYIDLAADLGCPRLRVFGGGYPQSISPALATNSLVKGLLALAERAAERHVVVCMETHDSWTDPAVVAGVMGRVDRPSIAVNWDIMHTQRQGGATMAEAWRVLRPWVRHVHVHDGREIEKALRVVPIGTGDYDHAAAIRLLVQSGYGGFVSGEWIESSADPAFFANHLGPELARLKAFEAAARR
jgi:sugar phosphate isomerase/epimerase